MSGHPLPDGCRGLHVLKLLKVLSPILQPNLVEMWDTVIPKLVQYLEGRKHFNFTWNMTFRDELEANFCRNVMTIMRC